MDTTPKSNIDKINDYVTNGSPLRQVFLIDSLLKVSNAILAHESEMRENMKNSPINPDAWIECAKDAIKHWGELK
jgi:hypothetical protein